MTVLASTARPGYVEGASTDGRRHIWTGVTNAPAQSFTDWKHQTDRGWQS